MDNSWRSVTVDEIKASSENALATGPFGSSIGSRFFTDYGVPVIRGSNLTDDVGERLLDHGLVFLDHSKAREFARSTVRSGDLIFTCWGTVNQVGLIDRRAQHTEYVISNKQMKLTPDPDKADSLFLYYLFSGPELQERIKNRSIGSSVPGFNLGQLKAMRISIPEVAEQRRIAEVLGSLDDKIHLNRNLWETIEATLRTLFKSWFLNPTSAAEWPQEVIGEHMEVTRGLSYTGAGLVAEGVPLHNLDSVREGGGYKHEGIKYYAGEFHERHLVRPGDLVVANTEQGFDCLLIGCPAIIPGDYGEDDLFSHHLFRVRPQPGSPLTSRFLYLLLCSPRFRGLVTSYSNGTTVNMLAADGLRRPKLTIPPSDRIARFDELTEPLFARQAGLHRESALLARLRDLLLPRLLSGELRVRQDDTLR